VRCARTRGWTDAGLRSELKSCAVPLTKLQSHVLRLLAAHRDLNSYVAGGIALNREGPRYSRDVDLFHDSEERLEIAANTDAEILSNAGLRLAWLQRLTGKREVEVEGLDDRLRLEWVHDSAFRFFPAQRDELFGYVLHPADLATNKASAAANRREPRDIIDLLTIHEQILPLGATVSAAVGRFPGQSPEEMLADINRHSRFTAEDFRVLSTAEPIDAAGVYRRIRKMVGEAELFVSQVPSDAVGVLFLQSGVPVEPDLDRLEQYERRSGAVGGVWPSSPEISRAMLQNYDRRG
jgi:nucleotidyltransferase AbiEii toxin of type IV toxin-antitoxin system